MADHRDFAKLNEDGTLLRAPSALVIDGTYTGEALLTEADYAAHGWLRVVDAPPEVAADEVAVATDFRVHDGRICRIYEIRKREPAPRRFSKLRIILAAKNRGKWDAMKDWIEAQGLADEWAACQFVQSDYAGFAGICEMIISSGVLTEEEVDAILAEAEDR